jgi:drug/metabolite transporter (DMT)-like permease
MTLTIFMAVLAAAAMHAAWNAIIKIRTDRFASMSLTTLGMAVAATPVLPFVAFPALSVWLWIIASIIIHVGYRLFLVKAYDAGDLAQTYALARGTAPLLTTVSAFLLFGEVLRGAEIGGIVLLSCGTFLMSFRGGGHARFNQRAVGFALITSMFIASYTLTDGYGARLADGAASYASWLFFCDGVCSIVIGFLYHGRSLLPVLTHEWKTGLLTGALSAGSYGIVLWAMTQAPIASVAALREASILFAMLISVYILGEGTGPWRIVAAILIGSGAVALRLG